MYDMYPDWGSQERHDTEAEQAVQAAIDRRDNGGERRDDILPAAASR